MRRLVEAKLFCCWILIGGAKREDALQLGLEHVGVKVNVRFWRDLWGLVGREIQCVESLTGYLATLQEKTA